MTLATREESLFGHIGKYLGYHRPRASNHLCKVFLAWLGNDQNPALFLDAKTGDEVPEH